MSELVEGGYYKVNYNPTGSLGSWVKLVFLEKKSGSGYLGLGVIVEHPLRSVWYVGETFPIEKVDTLTRLRHTRESRRVWKEYHLGKVGD